MVKKKPELQTLMTGIAIGESPRWHAERLWFCNWGMQEVVAVDIEGKSEVIVHIPTTLPFSIDWLPDGRLLVVSGPEALLLLREFDGSLLTYANLTGFSRHAWNEIVVDGRGNAYVNSIGFDFRGGEFSPGFIALVTSDGSTRLVADGIAFPNGMAVTPDNQTLIVAESYAKRLTAFDIEEDGSLSNRRVWADLGDGVPDGICLDAEGAAWYADVPNQRCVRVREGGAVAQTVAVDRGCFACMLGGPEGTTLYIVAARWDGPSNIAGETGTGRVLAVPAPAPHAGRP